MIRDGAPASWTSLMRDVAKEIADDASDPDPKRLRRDALAVETCAYLAALQDADRPWSALAIAGGFDPRGCWRDGLTERCGASTRAISDALTGLGRAGYELRVSLGRDARGREMFAVKGHAVAFRVRPLTPRPVPESPPDLAANDDRSSHQSAAITGGKGRTTVRAIEPQRSHAAALCSHPAVSLVALECDPSQGVTSNHKNLSLAHLAETARTLDPDVDEREITQILATLGGNPTINSPQLVLRAAIGRAEAGNFSELLTRARTDLAAAARAAANGHGPCSDSSCRSVGGGRRVGGECRHPQCQCSCHGFAEASP